LSDFDLAPPAGFVPVQLGGAFATHSGPLFARWVPGPVDTGGVDGAGGDSGGGAGATTSTVSTIGQGHLQLGFRVLPQHTNPGNACHGGMLSTFADILISNAAHYQTDIPRAFLPTISLQTDFMAPAPLGCWVQGQADVLKVTTGMVFSQGLITANGVLAVRCSGVFRRGPLLPDSDSDHDLKLPGMPPRKR
jgi:uncharacterized protein (TIGR00369 family)